MADEFALRLSPSHAAVMERLICSDLMSEGVASGLRLFAGLGCCSCERIAQLMCEENAETRQLSAEQDSFVPNKTAVCKVLFLRIQSNKNTLPTRKSFLEKTPTCIRLTLSYEA